jgi:hypothetical protein
MAHCDLGELYEKYPEIIREMESEFDSHDFIMALASRYQRLYIEALYDYRDAEEPFAAAHSTLAKRLNEHSDLICRTGDAMSPNVFGRLNSCARWRKVR